MDVHAICWFLLLLILIHCTDVENATTYKMKNAKLASVPTDIPTNSNNIYLMYNLINHLDDNVFSKYTKLRNLNLKKNKLAIVNQKSFEGLTEITSLDLQANLLTAFPNLTIISGSLTNLYLQNNNISSLPGNLIESLQKLNDLNLGENYISGTFILPPLPDLKILDMSSNDLNMILFIEPLPKLEVLKLNSNNISRTFILPHLSNLKDLQIQDNNINIIPVNIVLNSTSLTIVYMHYNQIEMFPDLSTIGSSLIKLDFSYNIIQHIPSAFLEGLTGLETVNLEHNKLNEFSDFGRFGGNLKYLYFSYNYVKHIPPAYLEGLTKLKRLELQCNMINGTFTFPSLPSLRRFDVGDNPINAIPVNDFNASHNITKINLSKTNMIVLPNITHLNDTLKHLYISKSKIDLSIYMPFLYKLETHGKLPGDLFSKVPNIKTIKASSNGYTKMPHFGSSGHQYLDSAIFANNKIQSIHMSSLRYLKHGTLKMKNNYLVCDMTLCWLKDKQWPFKFDDMECKGPPALKYANWSDVTLHKLTCLSKFLHYPSSS